MVLRERPTAPRASYLPTERLPRRSTLEPERAEQSRRAVESAVHTQARGPTALQVVASAAAGSPLEVRGAYGWATDRGFRPSSRAMYAEARLATTRASREKSGGIRRGSRR